MSRNSLALSRLVLWLSIVLGVRSLTSPTTWVTNSDIQAGIFIIVSGGAYQSRTTTYDLTYPTSFSVAPNVAVSILQIDISPTPTSMNWKVDLPNAANQIHLKVTMNYVITPFQSFKVGYIGISGSITYLKVDQMLLSFATGIATGTGFRMAQSSFNLNVVIDASHTLSIIPFMSGLNISTVLGDYSFGLTFAKNTNTNILYNVSVDGTTKITEMLAYILVYDITLGEAGQSIYLEYQPLTGANNTLTPFTLIYFSPTNLLAGISQFSYTSGFSFSFNPTDLTLTVPSSASGAYFTSIKFSFWSFRKRSCAVSTPYYLQTANLCYDICPAGYLPVDPDKYCKSCGDYMSHCTRCDNSIKCTQCDSTWTIISNGTGCTCANGYFVNGSICSACDSTCNTCSGGLATNCLSCKNTSYYVNPSNQCVVCISPCLTCSSSTRCLSCTSGNYLTGSNVCSACDTTCVECTAGGSNSCTSCDEVTRTLNGTKCSLIGGGPTPTPAPVTSCTDVTCQTCVSDPNICEQCKATFVLNNGSCSIPAGYYYSASNVTCYPCDGTCVTCSGPSATQCTGCQASQNRQLNATTSACDCKAGYYSPSSQIVCILQPIVCSQYFVLNSTTSVCDEICGDGRLFSLQCDDGNLVPNDGCDQNCKIQTNFSCSYGNSSSPSICSYNQQITFILLSAVKEAFNNTLDLTYRLQPELQLYEKFPDFTTSLTLSDSQIVASNSLISVSTVASSYMTILKALYSSESKTLAVSLNYNKSISGKTIQFTYTPPSSPQSLSLPNSSFAWPAKVSNRYSLNSYPDDIYYYSKILDKLTLGIFIGCLGIFVVSLFFRKMIGVELIIVAQVQVLSVAMLKQLHPYLSPLTNDKYIFGYNGLQDLLSIKYSHPATTNNLCLYLGLSPVFGENVNIMLLVIIITYLLSLTVGIAAVFVEKSTSKKIKPIAIILAREIAFGWLMFSVINMAVSYAIETEEGMIWKYAPQYSGVLKIVAIILIAIAYIVYACCFKESVDSQAFYRKSSRLAQLQPLFITTKAILIALGIVFYFHFGVIMLYTLMGIQLAYVVFCIILRPFKRKVDFIRSIIVESNLLYVIASRYVMSQFINLDSPQSWNSFLLIGIPVEYTFIGLSLFVSFISLILHLFKGKKQDTQIHPQQIFSQVDLLAEKKQKEQENPENNENISPMKSYNQDSFSNTKDSQTKFTQKKKPYRYKEPRRRKNLFTFEQIKNNQSLQQFINFSEADEDRKWGNDSRRKIKKEKSRTDRFNDLEIIRMDD